MNAKQFPEVRADTFGIRLLRTGMEDSVLLADIRYAIEHHKLTLDEIEAAIREHRELTNHNSTVIQDAGEGQEEQYFSADREYYGQNGGASDPEC